VIMICLYKAKLSREGQLSHNSKPGSKMVIQVVICSKFSKSYISLRYIGVVCGFIFALPDI
jgi:hypothetical protein